MCNKYTEVWNYSTGYLSEWVFFSLKMEEINNFFWIKKIFRKSGLFLLIWVTRSILKFVKKKKAFPKISYYIFPASQILGGFGLFFFYIKEDRCIEFVYKKQSDWNLQAEIYSGWNWRETGRTEIETPARCMFIDWSKPRAT